MNVFLYIQTYETLIAVRLLFLIFHKTFFSHHFYSTDKGQNYHNARLVPPPLLLCYLCVYFYNLIYLFTVTVFVLITGGGITERNLQRILEGSGAQEFHCSARSSRESAMKFRCVYFPVSGERWDLSLWLHALGDFLPLHVDLIIIFSI